MINGQNLFVQSVKINQRKYNNWKNTAGQRDDYTTSY